jgi:hypothetical protein
MSEPGPTPDGAHPIDARPIDIGMADLDTEPAADAGQRRSRVRRILLTSLVAVTAAGVAALGYTGWQITSQKDATITTPPTIGALRLDESEDGKSTADYLQTALSAEVELDKAVGAVYLDGAGKNVLFLGGTGLIWTPGSDLDTAFGLITDKQGSVEGIHEVDAGDLGGTMKCGTTKSDTGSLTVCGWADHGSLALAMFVDRNEADSATLLRQIRQTTQTRD